MTARLVLTGALGKGPEIRASKNGNPFATFSIRESLNGSTRWWQAITFNETAIETLKEIAVASPSLSPASPTLKFGRLPAPTRELIRAS